MDVETSGVLPEYALQPWRVRQAKTWLTSFAHVWRAPDGLRVGGGLATPYTRPDDALTKRMIAEFFEEVHDLKQYVTGWNTVYDISMMLAYGFEEEVFRTKWLDGMLLWRHWFIEPEYDKDRSKKRSYGLKLCVAEVFPDRAGYEEGVDFHDPSPGARQKLHTYNIDDNINTLDLTKHWWTKLYDDDPRRLKAALLEAECLPLLAEANLRGMVVDQIKAAALGAQMDRQALEALKILAPYGVKAKIAGDATDTVNSPKKMAELLFDDWGLPVYKHNRLTQAQKAKGMTEGLRSTDRETLFELSHEDPRAKQLLSLREALNLKTKFARSTIESALYNEDGCTHPQAIPFGTYSSRMTYASKQKRQKPNEAPEVDDDD